MTTGANVYWSKQSSLNDVTGILQAMRRVLSNVHTSLPVEVVNCTNSGGVSAIGTVTLKILMNQVDSFGNTVAPGATLYNVPYLRLQGGTNAIIIDPSTGDMGMASFCEKDISNIMATYGAANPNSNRRNSISDAIFVGYVGNVVPTQYIQFNASGITIFSPNAVNVNAPLVTVNAQEVDVTAPSVNVTGNVLVDGNLGSTSGTSVTVPTGTGQTLTFTDGLLTNAF